jgi:hypothetical protein
MRTLQSWLISWSCLAVCLLAALAGCGRGGGQSAIGIDTNIPNVAAATTATIDAGQSLPLLVGVVNDSAHAGATYAVSGPGSIIVGSYTGSGGDSDQIAITYVAPATVTGPTIATVTATSIHTPSQSASMVITIDSALVITTTVLANGTVGSVYNAAIAASGGTGTIKWSVATGTLPTGLTLNPATGALSGTPTAAGAYSFSIGVTDASILPNTVTQNYTVTIVPTPPAITTVSLPNAIAGTAYSQQLTTSGGGGGSPAFTLTTGSLPAGLSLSAAGLISGTPTNASAGSTYTFAVTVTIGTQTSAPVTLSIVVPALPAVATTTLPSGNIGIPYSQQLSYTGGAGGTVSWAIVAGSLPAASGLTLSTGGLLSGTPAVAVTYSFSVAVTVGTQTSAAQPLTLVINSLVITSGSSASGEVALPFSFHLTAQGGKAPYTWSLTAGAAALSSAGLSLNAGTGVLSGTPTTTSGSPIAITVQATDSASATATQAMTVTINPARSNANNAELNGQYAFLLSGFDAGGNPLASAGSFTANGTGSITTGVDDTNGTSLTAPVANATILASAYSVGPDNRGKLTLTTASGSATFVLALNSITAGIAGGGYLTEFDGSGNSLTGRLVLQTPSAFTTASIVSGFALGLEGFAANSTATTLVHRGVIGETQFNGTGGASSAELLATALGSQVPTTPLTTAISIGSNGRGTLAYTLASGGGTLNFTVYVVSSGKLFLLSSSAAGSGTGAADLLSGQALQQTTANGNFNTASLSGISVVRFESLGKTAAGTFYPDVQVGLFTFNGTGKLGLSSDENAGGAVTSDAPTGSYSVAANGRVALTLSSTFGGCADCVTTQSFFYLVGAGQGFMMDFTSPVNFGYFEPQTATSFSAGSFSGSYSAGTLEPLVVTTANSVASLVSTGASAVTGNADLNSNGTLTADYAIAEAYVVSPTGRTVVTTTANSKPILYIISTTKALSIDLSSGSPIVQEIQH